MSTKQSGEQASRIETDDPMFCIDCGVLCAYYPMVVEGFDRCPDCYLDRERQRVRAAFGSDQTAEVMRSFERPADYGVDEDGPGSE